MVHVLRMGISIMLSRGSMTAGPAGGLAVVRVKQSGFAGKEVKEMRNVLLTTCGLVLALCLASNSYADRRAYAWTYEYVTVPQGLAELEYYVTTQVADTDESSVNTWKHWIELEYGLTNRWDIAMYQMLKEENTALGSTFEYDGFKVRARYRIGEKGKFFLDPLLYFEYIRDDDLSQPHVGEVKLVLAKDIGSWNVSYNQIVKSDLEKDAEVEHEYAIGVSYESSGASKFGIESKGNFSESEFALGPTVSFVAKRFWLTFGVAVGLNDRTDDVQTRMLVGIPF